MLTIGPTRQPPALFVPLLGRLPLDCAREFGVKDARLGRMTYEERPYSHLLEVRVFADSGAFATSLFVKILKVPRDADHAKIRDRVARDFETTRTIHTAMSRFPELGTVRPVACYPDELAMVTEKAEGQTLLAVLRARASRLTRRSRVDELHTVLERVGRWVRAFQSVDGRLGTLSLPALREYMQVRLDRLASEPVAAFSAADRQHVLDHFDVLAHEVPEADLAEVRTHADLAPANVLISPGRVVVLDFAMAGRGSAVHDLARLFVQMDLLAMKPHVRPGVIDALQQSLLRGYEPALSAARPLFRLLLLVHRINHLTTLSVARERFPANLYSQYVRSRHRHWLERELSASRAHMEAPA